MKKLVAKIKQNPVMSLIIFVLITDSSSDYGIHDNLCSLPC